MPQKNAVLESRIREVMGKVPGQMAIALARELGVSEADVLKNMPEQPGIELDISRWQEIIQELPPFGPVHVIVSNAAATLECTGVFGEFSEWGGYFNVQTDSLDMHIRYQNLGSIFAAERPTHRAGANTYSIQFFDKDGNSAFKVYLNFGAQNYPKKFARDFKIFVESTGSIVKGHLTCLPIMYFAES